jgi:NAD(P)-dependent dehydrogenase (short-subunit alcohol dehydrogenase family)
MSLSKIALVTGGSRGLGKNMAMRLAEKGNDVIITYQSQKQAAETVVKEIEAMGQQSVALSLDVSDFPSLDKFVHELTEILSSKWTTAHFDFLVNNAGNFLSKLPRSILLCEYSNFYSSIEVYMSNIYRSLYE